MAAFLVHLSTISLQKPVLHKGINAFGADNYMVSEFYVEKSQGLFGFLCDETISIARFCFALGVVVRHDDTVCVIA